jgi:hypothetical protein
MAEPRRCGLSGCEALGSFESTTSKTRVCIERASRQAVSGQGSHCGGRRCAPTPLRCSARGRFAKLVSFVALTPLKQAR